MDGSAAVLGHPRLAGTGTGGFISWRGTWRVYCAQSCWRLRQLATDPHVHHVRLRQDCPRRLEQFLKVRPALRDLQNRNIVPLLFASSPERLVRMQRLDRALRRLQLEHRLRARPHVRDLVARGVLPARGSAYYTALPPAPGVAARMSMIETRARIVAAPKAPRVPPRQMTVRELISRFSAMRSTATATATTSPRQRSRASSSSSSASSTPSFHIGSPSCIGTGGHGVGFVRSMCAFWEATSRQCARLQMVS